MAQLHHQEVGAIRGKQPDETRDVVVTQGLVEFRLLVKTREGRGVVDEPIAHHF